MCKGWNARHFIPRNLSGSVLLKNLHLWWVGSGQQPSTHTATHLLLPHYGMREKIEKTRSRKIVIQNKASPITAMDKTSLTWEI